MSPWPFPAASVAAAAILVLLLPAPARTEGILTLERAVAEAVTHNAALRSARAGAEESAARLAEAKSAWWPRVSFAESWQRGDQPVFVFSSLLSARRFSAENFAIDALNHPDPVGFFRTSVGIEQVLFDGGSREAGIRSARLRHEAAQHGVNETAASLTLEVVQAYGRILAAEAAGRAAAGALEAAEEDRARAAHRRDIGAATDADVLALVAHVANLRQQLIQRGADAAAARAELNRLDGASIERDFEVVEPPPGQRRAADVAALVAEANRSRPELRRAAAAVELADAARTNARAAALPQLAARAGLEVSGTSFVTREPAWIVAGELRWTLSVGGGEIAAAKAAARARERAQADADDARTLIHVEVVTALRRLEAADARREAGRAAVDEARESQRMIRDRFEAGLAGVTDVLRASSALLEAEAQRTSAAVDAMVGEAMLRHAIGQNP